ncbi:MAG: molecular chaperone TorD family protein [Chloroflexi bacterium]|nr:molecular chaperone TorD family protein [Chloroflexota bacterium]
MATATIATWEPPLARSAAYELLSLAFLYPAEGACTSLAEKARHTAEAASALGWHEVAEASQAVASRLATASDEELLEHYVDVFGHGVSKDCPQYEGEYLETHIFLKSQTLAEVNAFYTAFGVGVNPDLHDRLDHISVEMEFMHILTTKEAYALLHGHGVDKVHLCQDAQKAFLKEHLANWSRSFVRRVGRKAGQDTPYGALAHLLDAHLKAEYAAHHLQPAPSRQVIIPLEMEEEESLECPVDANPL